MQRVIVLTSVLKDALATNIRQVMTFMVTHAATIFNRFSVGQDGKTPMEKARGTRPNREMAEFGEKILFQPMTKYNEMNKLDVRWQYGLFMDVATRTNEIMVIGPDGNARGIDFLEVARRHKMGCRSGDERERISIWDGV